MSSVAKTVSFSPLRRSQFNIKNTLDTPFRLKWPTIPSEIASKLLMELEKSLSDMKGCFARSKLSKRRSKRKGKQSKTKLFEEQEPPRKKPRTSQRTVDDSNQGTSTGSAGGDSSSQLASEQLETSLSKKSQVVFGVNNVTRCLERGELCAGLVCLSAKPALVTRHIMMLAATRCVPFAALPNLSQRAVGLLGGIKSVLAIGFKKSASCEFSSLVEAISKFAPPIVLPWLSAIEEREDTLSSNEPAMALAMEQVELTLLSHCNPTTDKDETVKEVPTAKSESSDKKLSDGREKERGGNQERNEGAANIQPAPLYTPVQIRKTVTRTKKRKRKN